MDVYYFKTGNSSFVLTDKAILEEYFSVYTYHINNQDGAHYVFSLLKLLLFLIIKGQRARIYFIRFADWHTALIAFFSKIFSKKMVIVVGGFDAFHLPQYAYGVYHRKFRGWCARYALRNATMILPNSPCLVEYTNTYASPLPVKGGIRYFEPRIKGQIKVVYNGFDTHRWKSDSIGDKQDYVLTVALVNNLKTYQLKGVDSFIELAGRMPNVRFKIVGLTKSFLSHNNIITPGNLEVIEPVPHHELLKHYKTAKVFCLFSLTEGMSNVLCEAMLCECIPVGSNVTLIPEIIGDTGFIVHKNSVAEMEQQVDKALQSDFKLGSKARQRIIDNYSLEIRKKSLFEIVSTLISSSQQINL